MMLAAAAAACLDLVSRLVASRPLPCTPFGPSALLYFSILLMLPANEPETPTGPSVDQFAGPYCLALLRLGAPVSLHVTLGHKLAPEERRTLSTKYLCLHALEPLSLSSFLSPSFARPNSYAL